MSSPLSARQRQIVCRIARGEKVATIALSLGVSPSTAATHARLALRKLGVRTRAALAGEWPRLSPIVHQSIDSESCGCARTPLPTPAVPLSAGEREVLALISLGASNAEAARARGTSPRTIANQVASILAKLGAPTRVAAAAWLGSSSPLDAASDRAVA